MLTLGLLGLIFYLGAVFLFGRGLARWRQVAHLILSPLRLRDMLRFTPDLHLIYT